MKAKCNCVCCKGELEFDSADSGRQSTCPLCGGQTMLVARKKISLPKEEGFYSSEKDDLKIFIGVVLAFAALAYIVYFALNFEDQKKHLPEIIVVVGIGIIGRLIAAISKEQLLPQVFSIILFFIGCGMVWFGCSADHEESLRPDGSAVRQIKNVCQYGFGFVIIAASIFIYTFAARSRK